MWYRAGPPERNWSRVIGLLGVLTLVALALPACVGKTARMNPDSQDGKMVGPLGSQDFRSICHQVAQSLVRIPQIQQAKNPPTIAFTEVVNASDELFSTDDCLYKMRTELIKNGGGKLVFLDRDIIDQIMAERRAKERGQVTGRGQERPVFGADYFLAGRVESLRRARGREQTNYMRFSFRLTDASSTAVVWEDDYEFKNYSKAGAYDR